MRVLLVIAFLFFAAPAQAFDLVGVVGKDKPVQLRVKLPSGKWTHWRRVHVGDPVWARNATKAQMRGATAGLRLKYVRLPKVRPTARKAATLPLPATNAKPPKIIPRSSWDPDSRCKPRTTPGLGNIQMAFVHHTVSLNGYSRAQSAGMVLGICLFHRDGNGWNDMGYNFLVDRYGQVFEGRAGGIDQPVVGAQAGGFNVPSTGVSMIGDFSYSLPPKAAMTSLARLLAWKLSLTGVPATGRTKVISAGGPSTAYRAGTQVTLNRISGHRDADQTACPGARLYRRLPALRKRVAKLEGAVSRLSLTGGSSVAYGTPLTLSGSLTPASGGETVALRALAGGTEETVATALTAPDGSWSADVSLERSSVVRAVYRGGPTPGVISNVAGVQVLPVISLTAGDPAQGEVPVSGTVQPTRELVTITAYQGTKKVKTRRLRVSDGAFSGTVALPGAAAYSLVASVPADAATGAARSNPVKLPASR